MRVLMAFTVSFLLPACLPLAASGNQVFMSEDDLCNPHGSMYTVNEIVYVCGDLDIADFPCPVADIYIIANTGATYFTGTALIDGMGGPVTIQSCQLAGAFFGEIIATPPLPAGTYDVVIDEHQDAVFGAEDYVLGDGAAYAFEVVSDPLAVGDETHVDKSRATLGPIVPNPFRNLSTINLTLTEAGPVQVRVVDARGGLVRILADRDFMVGQHTVSWDGRDLRGAAAANGLYYCVLEAGAYRALGKIVLLR